MFPDKNVADSSEPLPKRQRKDGPVYTGTLNREISPPPLSRSSAGVRSASTTQGRNAIPRSTDRKSTEKERRARPTNPLDFIDLTGEESESLDTTTAQVGPKSKQKQLESKLASPGKHSTKALPSPFKLTSIRDLPASENVDTVGIKDILGDVMIKEAWIFNYLVDLDWVMAKFTWVKNLQLTTILRSRNQFDPDGRHIVDVKIVHGSWRKEDSNRIRLEEQSKNYPNTKIICAYMPEPFGTHHSKVIVLFRHDDFAQVIIHTSNMIAFDWTNMTQAAWCSPLLPLIPVHDGSPKTVATITSSSVGNTFKNDILAYFEKYDKSRTGGLTQKLKGYSFDGVKAVFIGSVPGRFQVDGRGKGEMWGWMALKRIMGNIPLGNRSPGQKESGPGRIVVQISSIATLGQTNTWLSPVLYKALSVSKNDTVPPPISRPEKPKLSIIFPTAEEVRDSLNGYNSGTAIHIKIQSKAQQKQLNYMRPFLCHWNPSSKPAAPGRSSLVTPARLSGRSRAAPHIKTYIRFADEACTKIDWAMLTSANLSTQAWGGCFGNSLGTLMGRGEGEVKICSYEAGVVVHPALFKDFVEEDVEMVPVCKKDTPDVRGAEGRKLVGLRMPYDLPIKAYEEKDMPWCATMDYGVLDSLGRNWEGS